MAGKSALRGIPYLIGQQISTRVLTFVLNLFVARQLDPTTFGVASIQLHVLLQLMYLAREGVRRACLRAHTGETRTATQLAQAHNVAWLTVPLYAVVGPLVCYSFARVYGEAVPGYTHTVMLYGVGGLVLVLSEPLYILAQNQLLFGRRLAIEATATTAQCVATYVLVVHAGAGLLAYGVAWMLYAAVVTVAYYSLCVRGGARVASLLPQWGAGFDGTLFQLSATFTAQSVEKFLLAEGEKVVLMTLRELSEQGVFGIVSNLGSLAVRFVFLPIEEAVFMQFGMDVRAVDECSEWAARTAALRKLERVYMAALKLVGLIGLCFVAFGPNYAFLLMDMLYGGKWSSTDAPLVLSWYCGYVLFVAVNGVSEAFFQAAASPPQLRRWSVLMVGFSAVYLALAVLLVGRFDTIGLILANCGNMAVRIASSLYFSRRFFHERGDALRVRMCVPAAPVLGVFACGALATRLSNAVLCCSHGMLFRAAHVGVGGVCVLALGAALWISEREWLGTLRMLWAAKKQQPQKPKSE